MVAMTWIQAVSLAVTLAGAVLPIVWDIVKSSSGIEKEEHSDFVRKLKTLRALRDDLKSKATQYRSTKEQTMDDWFHRVMDVEKRAQELENKIEEKQGSVNLVTRSKLKKIMAKMILEISELITEGSILWGCFDEQ